ncbi:MAG: GNAT family N-acetyltransferase [Planctomycetia bacterium]|nr:GNAT family N-acetyltransferase [Planctomycetia bacterium]
MDAIGIRMIREPDVTSALDNQLRDFLSRIFPEWAEIFKSRRCWHEARPVFSIIAECGNRIVGHVGVVERTITNCWNWRYNVGSFQGVSVDPEFRGQGLGKALLDRALEESKQYGYDFVILFCKEPLVPFYCKLGWKLPEDSMIMWRDRELPIAMRSNCPMYQVLGEMSFPEGPIDVHNPFEISLNRSSRRNISPNDRTYPE